MRLAKTDRKQGVDRCEFLRASHQLNMKNARRKNLRLTVLKHCFLEEILRSNLLQDD